MPVPLRFVVTLEPAPGTFSFATKTLIVEGGVIHLGTAGIGMNPQSSPSNSYFECDHDTEKFAFLFSPGDGNVWVANSHPLKPVRVNDQHSHYVHKLALNDTIAFGIPKEWDGESTLVPAPIYARVTKIETE